MDLFVYRYYRLPKRKLFGNSDHIIVLTECYSQHLYQQPRRRHDGGFPGQDKRRLYESESCESNTIHVNTKKLVGNSYDIHLNTTLYRNTYSQFSYDFVYGNT